MSSLEAITTIEGAISAKSLLGSDPKNTYHALAKLCHPDVVDTKLKTRAEKAFARLTQLYAELNGKAANGHAPVKIGKWIIESPLARGDVASIYHAVDEDGSPAVFKIAADARNNDLMAAEHGALKKMHGETRSDNFKKYIPALLDSFDASGRRVNVISAGEGATLADIAGEYAKGLDFRHIVWMGNRLLSVLGFAHQCGIVHGAVFPEHLIYSSGHGLTLIDWCYSSTDGKMKARSAAHKAEYPKEVARKIACAQTDIYMAARTLQNAAERPIPKRFRDLFSWCLADSPSSRPVDAWALQDKWKALAEEEYGKPKFVKLKERI